MLKDRILQRTRSLDTAKTLTTTRSAEGKSASPAKDSTALASSSAANGSELPAGKTKKTLDDSVLLRFSTARRLAALLVGDKE